MSEAEALTRPDHPQAVPAADSGLPVLVVTVSGILAASVLLVGYYVFVVKCGLDCRRSSGDDPVEQRRSQLPTKPESRGLDGAAIRAIPIVQYLRRGSKEQDADCAICLAEFEPGERLRRLPSCYHAFHIDCVDAWLQSNTNCPLCRSDMINVKLSQLKAPVTGRDRTGVVIEVRDDDRPTLGSGQQSMLPAKVCISLADDCIGTLGKDSRSEFQWAPPMRRSFSLDSSCGRRFYQEAEQPQWLLGSCRSEGSSIIGEASS